MNKLLRFSLTRFLIFLFISALTVAGIGLGVLDILMNNFIFLLLITSTPSLSITALFEKTRLEPLSFLVSLVVQILWWWLIAGGIEFIFKSIFIKLRGL